MKKLNKTKFKGSAMLNPVPVVLISCKNKAGLQNVFTVGWIGTACTKPPMITVAIRKERLSYEYIKDTMEFVVNIPSKHLVREVDFCGVRSGRSIDKIKECNFNMIPCDNISVDMIESCPITLECKVKSITELGTHDLFLAEILSSYVDDTLIDEKGKIHFENANLITYAHGEYFEIKPNSLGSFGYSVMKKKTAKRKNLEKHKNKTSKHK